MTNVPDEVVADTEGERSTRARLTGYGRVVASRLEDHFLLRCLRRFVAISGTDRAMSIGAHVFSTLIPIAIVLTATVSASRNGAGLADRVITRYRLSGPAADAVQVLLSHAPAPTSLLASVLGVVVVLFSGLSFTRALQRAYLAAWGLPTIGWRAYLFGLSAVGVLVADVILITSIGAVLHGGYLAQVSWLVRLAANFAAWLFLQWVLLGRQVRWRLLWPGAVLSAIGLTATNWASALFMPRIMTHNAVRYGAIGVTFALLTWFLVMAVVLVAGAVVSAEAGGAAAVTRASLARVEAAAAIAAEGDPAAANVATIGAPPAAGSARGPR